MPQQKPTRARLKGSIAWNGNQSVSLYCKVTEGPDHLLDRPLTLVLTFEEAAYLARVVADGATQLEKSEATLKRINQDNA